MKKNLVLLATTALLANVAASSVVFATEGAEAVTETEAAEPEGAEAEAAKPAVDSQKEELKAQLVEIYNELVSKRTAGWKYPGDDEAGTKFDSVIKGVETTIDRYQHIENYMLNSVVGQLRSLMEDFEAPEKPETKPGDNNTTPEKPETKPGDNNTTPEKSETKPGTETPEKPAQPKEETPKVDVVKPSAEAPKEPQAESNQPVLPNTGDTESATKSKDMTVEKPTSTTTATLNDNKQLPNTGEVDSFAIFSAATLTILGGLGMLAYGKREEI